MASLLLRTKFSWLELTLIGLWTWCTTFNFLCQARMVKCVNCPTQSTIPTPSSVVTSSKLASLSLLYPGTPPHPPLRRISNGRRFLWTISMTWIISRIHKRTRKSQMERNRYAGKERVLDSQGSTFSRNHFTNSPLNDVSANQYAHY